MEVDEATIESGGFTAFLKSFVRDIREKKTHVVCNVPLFLKYILHCYKQHIIY